MTDVFIIDTNQGLDSAINEIFSHIEKSGPILKSSKEVYIKVNGIDFKKHTYTSPEVLEAVIVYLKKKGAEVYVMENSTQGNFTRLVFAVNGYKDVCEKTGANIIYLDEEETETFQFRGKASVKEDPKGYNLMTFRLPQTVVKIMENRDTITYINIPKLKTHSMAVVTLGIKNQWGFPQHADRGKDHNYNLHSKLIDMFEILKPDITLIDGTEGTIHGHYPPTAWEDKLVIPFNILIGGTDTLAVDVVGARIFGLTIDNIPHLRIAYERGLGEGDLSKIKVVGKDLEEYKEIYDWKLFQKFPETVKIIKGKDLLCREGCQDNPLIFLQNLAFDYPEKFKGGWFIIMGKGHDDDLIEQLKSEGYTKGLVAGYCAINEVGKDLRKEFGRKNVFFSGDCNNLAETVKAELKLAGMSAFDLPPLSYEETMKILQEAQKHGTKALIAVVF
ncbi:MAG: DUF362 domain-containing protein [Candidatus Lokiarchaeota archaeon]|nr:DUF362 domain-containing protein [Candidatus Lokiarchaeota archaeon]